MLFVKRKRNQRLKERLQGIAMVPWMRRALFMMCLLAGILIFLAWYM